MNFNTDRKKKYMESLLSVSKDYIDENTVYSLEHALNTDSSISNSYHNQHHMMAVALRTEDIFDDIFGKENDLPWIKYNRFITYIAASCHDLGHCGYSTELDSDNISRARNITKKLFRDIDQHTLSDILSLISCTQYPFIVKPQNLSQCVIRDSDLLMCLEDDFELFFYGLMKETSNSVSTFEDSFNFLNKQRFYTTPGRKKFKDCYNRYLENTRK